MNRLQKKGLSKIGILKRKEYLQNADYNDLKSFAADLLNEPNKKKRQKSIEEFRKRHLEFHEFLKENTELISAETEISKTINAVISGDSTCSEDKKLTNFFEVIKENFKNDV